jgi:hypothetical protein
MLGIRITFQKLLSKGNGLPDYKNPIHVPPCYKRGKPIFASSGRDRRPILAANGQSTNEEISQLMMGIHVSALRSGFAYTDNGALKDLQEWFTSTDVPRVRPYFEVVDKNGNPVPFTEAWRYFPSPKEALKNFFSTNLALHDRGHWENDETFHAEGLTDPILVERALNSMLSAGSLDKQDYDKYLEKYLRIYLEHGLRVFQAHVGNVQNIEDYKSLTSVNNRNNSRYLLLSNVDICPRAQKSGRVAYLPEDISQTESEKFIENYRLTKLAQFQAAFCYLSNLFPNSAQVAGKKIQFDSLVAEHFRGLIFKPEDINLLREVVSLMTKQIGQFTNSSSSGGYSQIDYKAIMNKHGRTLRRVNERKLLEYLYSPFISQV